MSINEGQVLRAQSLHQMFSEEQALPLPGGGGPGLCVRTVSICILVIHNALMSDSYLRALEEHLSRSESSGQHGPLAGFDHSQRRGALLIGEEDVDVPPTPQVSSTLLDSQTDIGWRSMSHGMYMAANV